MEAVGRVSHSVTFQHVEVFVYGEQIALSDLVESQTQSLGVVRPARLGPRGDLPGQTRIMTAVE